MRFFATASYNGANYFGWQVQPHQPSVQSTIEEAFSTILNTPTGITGCGRTDTGVHARNYVFHFDAAHSLPPHFLSRLNRYLPKDIVIHRIRPVKDEAHARFDAYERSYEYHLTFEKDPFNIHTAYYFSRGQQLDLQAMEIAAQELLKYREFYPFCKSDHDAKTLNCQLTQSTWEKLQTPQKLIFQITSNRFLRGMVRLIVGMCLNVGLGKLTIDEVRLAMDRQERLSRPSSAPPEGLFLRDIKYPEHIYLEVSSPM